MAKIFIFGGKWGFHIWNYLVKLTITIFYDPEIPSLIAPKETFAFGRKKTHLRMFITSLFVITNIEWSPNIHQQTNR